MAEATLLLQALAAGEAGAADRLYALLYAELKRLAGAHLRASGSTTLDPPGLIHELWLRTRGMAVPQHRAQFFALASRVMRSVVVDHLRKRSAFKRGGGLAELTLDTAAFRELAAEPGGASFAEAGGQGSSLGGLDVERIEAALRALETVDERAHRVVEMRFFGGMLQEEIAEVLGVSVPTVKRDWRRARAFLYEQLSA